MIDEIINLKNNGLSFRKIANELNTTVGKVQYCWNKWSNSQKSVTGQKAISALRAEIVTPKKIDLLWEVSDVPKKIILMYFNQSFSDLVQIIRIYDVSQIIFNGRNAHQYFEVAVSYDEGKWSIKGLATNRSYVFELGVKLMGNDFFPIFRSNCVCLNVEQSTISHSNEELTPSWTDHVSTYTYYGQTAMEEENE